MFQYSNGHSLGADIAIGLGKTFEKNCILTRNVFFLFVRLVGRYRVDNRI